MPLHDFRSVCLIYCLSPHKDGGYQVLNREYKPLGCAEGDAAMQPHPIKWRITPVMGNDEEGIIFLYHDGCVPTANPKFWNMYQAKLRLLSKLKAPINQQPKGNK
jgi:hypothetical protein